MTNGNNFVRKGIKYLIEAFNSLKLNNSELWIVGANDKNFAKKMSIYDVIYGHPTL